MEEKSGYLYMMEEDGRRLVKIGISTSPPQREKQLNSTKMPIKVRLIKQIKTPYFKQAEKNFHRMLHNQRVEGEWFELSLQDICSFMLLTSADIERFCTKHTNARSITELIAGGISNYMESSKPYEDYLTTENQRLLDAYRVEVKNLKEENKKLTSHVSQLSQRFNGLTKSNHRLESNVRAVLRNIIPRGAADGGEESLSTEGHL
jgi:tRNA(Met) C34 N-acetyltransferase TmcA